MLAAEQGIAANPFSTPDDLATRQRVLDSVEEALRTFTLDAVLLMVPQYVDYANGIHGTTISLAEAERWVYARHAPPVVEVANDVAVHEAPTPADLVPEVDSAVEQVEPDAEVDEPGPVVGQSVAVVEQVTPEVGAAVDQLMVTLTDVAQAATMSVRSSETGNLEFSPTIGGQFMLDNLRLASDGARLYIANEHGRFVPDQSLVELMFLKLRGVLWRSKHASEVVKWLILGAPRTTMPPANVVPLQGQVMELPSGRLRDYREDERWPVQMSFAYDADAQAPEFERWFEQMQPDDAVRMRLLQFVGLAMTTETRHQRMQLYVGGGSNGKSVFADIAQALIGEANTAAVSIHDIGEDRFAIADLQGTVLCLTGEVEDRELTTTATLKAIVRGESRAAQFKHGQRFELWPKCKVISMANALPMTADSSDGFFRSIDIVKWEHHIPTDRQDRFLTGRMIANELPGIGRLALEALLRLEADGDFIAAPEIDAANLGYRESTDAVTAFIEDCVTMNAGATVPRSALYAGYKSWATEQGRNVLGTPKFNARVAARLGVHGITSRKSHGTMIWDGCELTAPKWGGLR